MRTVYSLFDLLADVGGLLSAFAPINSFLILLLQYRGSFFAIMNDNVKTDSSNNCKEQAIRDTNQWQAFKLNLKFWCPTVLTSKCICCRCLKMNKRERIIARNYLKLEKEIHISYILKNMRVLKMLVK